METSQILDYDNIATDVYADENFDLFTALLQHSNSPSQINKTWRKGLMSFDKSLILPPENKEREKRLNETFNPSEYIPPKPSVRKVLVGDIGEVFKDVPLPNLQLAHRLKRYKYPDDPTISRLSNLSDRFGEKITILKQDVMLNARRMNKRTELRNYTKRKLIFREIIETERTYMESLKNFMTKYIVNMGNYIPEELMDEISENVRMVIKVNSPLLRDLEKLMAGYGPSLHKNLLEDGPALDSINIKELYEPRGVPDLFINKNQEFKAYSKYANFYSQALKDINRLMENNEEFRKFTFKVQKELKKKRCRCTTIRSFLIMPIQRIPRYKLLLQDLHKRSADLENTRPQFYEKIALAKSMMDDTATFLNLRKKEFENRIIVVELMKKFTKLKFLIQEELKYKSHVSIEGVVDAESITVYVFTNHVLIQTRRIRGGKVRGTIQSISSDDPHVRVYLDKETSRIIIIELEEEILNLRPGSKAEAMKLFEHIYRILKVEGLGLKSYSNTFERPIFLGWLKKESEGIKSRYLKKRFFVVTADMKLKYYDKEPMSGGKFRKGFSLVGAKVGLAKNKHYKAGFFVQLDQKKRCYFFKAENDQERDTWVGLLCNDLNCERVESYK